MARVALICEGRSVRLLPRTWVELEAEMGKESLVKLKVSSSTVTHLLLLGCKDLQSPKTAPSREDQAFKLMSLQWGRGYSIFKT